jgi:RNA polymerase sigma-70 factor (ECF subfamily)
MMDPKIQQLIKAARRGNEDAFGELVTSHYERIYRHLWTYVRNEHDARDLAQETWIKVWDKIHTFRSEAPFGAWVARIATRTALDFLRRKKRLREVALPGSDERSLPQDTDATAPDRPDEALRKSEILNRFHSALGTLSEKHRTVLALRELEGLSYAEIAKILRCRAGTVMSRLFNARKAVQSKLKDLL